MHGSQYRLPETSSLRRHYGTGGGYRDHTAHHTASIPSESPRHYGTSGERYTIRGVGAAQGTIVGANWMGKTKAAMQTVLIGAGLLVQGVVAEPGPLYTALRSGVGAGGWLVIALAWGFFAVFLYWNRALFVGEADWRR